MKGESFFVHILFFVLANARSARELTEDEALYAPRIEKGPRNQTVADGGVAFFVCTVDGNPNPQIEWRKNSKKAATLRYSTIDIPNGSVFRIDPVKESRDDAATVECVVANGVGEPATASAVLNVLPEDTLPPGFPEFLRSPKVQAIEKGQTALLPCQVKGEPQPVVAWLKNMIPLNMTDPRYAFVEDSLQIKDIKEEDKGDYECMAENSVGTALSDPAGLYVRVRRVPPQFTIRPDALYSVLPGSTLNVPCVAVGHPMPSVKWRKGSVVITPDLTAPIGKNYLVLENITESSNYTCIAESHLGSIEATTEILLQVCEYKGRTYQLGDDIKTSDPCEMCSCANTSVDVVRITCISAKCPQLLRLPLERECYQVFEEGKCCSVDAICVPMKPELTVHLIQEEPDLIAEVSWSQPSLDYEDLKYYRLRYNRRDAPQAEERILDFGTLKQNISNLDCGTRYDFYLSAGYTLGWGHEAFVFLDTPEDVPSAPPQNLRYVGSSNITVISWDPPALEHSNGKIAHYEIESQTTDNATSSERRSTSDIRMIFRVSGERKEHLFRVRACTSKGAGPWSSWIRVSTLRDVSPAPTNVLATATSAHSVKVSWDSVPNIAGVLGYQVMYSKNITGHVEQWSYIRVPPTTSAELTGLDGNVLYGITVAAITADGLSRNPELITARVFPTEQPSRFRCECDWRYLKHYETKKCSPVFEEECDCPVYFNCTDTKTSSENACEYKGEIYQLGERIKTSSPCNRCFCRKSYPGGIEIRCVAMTCPSLLRLPQDVNCYEVYEADKCCSVGVKCANPEAESQGNITEPTCHYGEKTYFKGQRIYPEDDFCKSCLCDENWIGITSNSCQIHDCLLEAKLRYFSRGCIPIYHEKRCCPIEFYCGTEDYENLDDSLIQKTDGACFFKGKSYAIGDVLDIKHPTNCVTCKCRTPPDFTCVHASCLPPPNDDYENCRSVYHEGECCPVYECLQHSTPVICEPIKCVNGCQEVVGRDGCAVCLCGQTLCAPPKCPEACELDYDVPDGNCTRCKCPTSINLAPARCSSVECDPQCFEAVGPDGCLTCICGPLCSPPKCDAGCSVQKDVPKGQCRGCVCPSTLDLFINGIIAGRQIHCAPVKCGPTCRETAGLFGCPTCICDSLCSPPKCNPGCEVEVSLSGSCPECVCISD